MSDPFCVGLEQVRRGDLAVAGGKAANLGELLHAGFDVPPGFVVTTQAYRAAVGPARALDDVKLAGLPVDVADAIRQAYRSMSDGPVAVRSSATAEDLPGAAFAGQQDTFLGVQGEDAVVEAVQACWASLFTDRAVAYRQRLGIDPAGVAMAVVVQAMVPADVAGVMFTADPVTGARDEVVIAAARGLGEAVVSGEVTP
ncbi:MAG: PEP/pyruvate-binding domain-containing protein, partial [Arachnia sp.]